MWEFAVKTLSKATFLTAEIPRLHPADIPAGVRIFRTAHGGEIPHRRMVAKLATIEQASRRKP
jgi:hypothetical protein